MTRLSLKLKFTLARRRAAMQRKEPVANARFLAAQFHDL
jgi:hypothetical protein